MRPLGLLLLAVSAFPCGTPPPKTNVPALDPAFFEQQVEPELLASCAYSGCHGAALRPMRLFAPSGERLDEGLTSNQPLTAEEHRANFVTASAAAAVTSATLPDLLRKPLQEQAGGAGHGGVDRYGRNVYPNTDDERWKTLQAWVNGARADAPDGGTGGGTGGTGGGAGGGDGGGTGGGSGGNGGGGASCTVQPNVTYQRVGAIVTSTTCAAEAGCHTPTNAPDAGCFVADTCETLRLAGCVRRSVVPCNPAASRIVQYTGARPYGVKSHQGVLLPIHVDALVEWINAGASCDGGAFP